MKYYKCDPYKIEFTLLDNCTFTFENHNHVSIYAIGLILAGDVTLTKKNVACKLSPDDLFIIPPYMVHSLAPSAGQYSIVTLCIGTEFLDTYAVNNGKRLIQNLANQLDNGFLTHRQVEAFVDALELVYNMAAKFDDYTEIITETKNFIEARPEENITLDTLAQQVFISKYYLIREFKKTIGLSPHRFLIQNRIRKAQHLLTNGSTITETAQSTGFYDQSHFIKYFKKIVGITPSEYLESLKFLD